MRWIKLYSKFQEWEWHDNPAMVSLLMHLLVMANSREKRWHGIAVGRGQLITSRKSLSLATGLSENTVRTCLARLQRCGTIATKSTSLYTLITLCNYNSYQPEGDDSRQPLTKEAPATHQPLTTTSEGIEYKNNNLVEVDETPCARVREEGWLNELLRDQSRLQQMAMSLHTSVPQVKELAQETFAGWQATAVTHSNRKEFLTHILNTIRIKHHETNRQHTTTAATTREQRAAGYASIIARLAASNRPCQA